ncbi:ATP-dependent metallopeptidase FtsH/Yme1/Tma family protein [Roseibium sp. RKSG952]|uniref:ATP-dependent metallopeptidase FtsH/Yme1/Tma family protein n=1 Tax=Roseibium sp. RKSG952 TaxID=2529384 RepID=UPI0012BCDF4F|nr:AAA family ATPase [Roseibium sp. RKSG952]MTH94927.1 ATP-dependent zinc metalloprotease FtsH [Roseibium sp. RKSG952]
MSSSDAASTRRKEKINLILLTIMPFFVALIVGTFAPRDDAKDPDPVKTVTYNEFLELVETETLAEAEITRKTVISRTTEGDRIKLTHNGWLYSGDFPKELAEAGVTVSFPDNASTVTPLMVFGIVIELGFPLVIMAVLIFIGTHYLKEIRKSVGKTFNATDPSKSIMFSDVAGHQDTKFELAEIKSFLKDPSAYERVGAKPPRGILMIGPPGTGKTLLARALAGEAGAHFLSVSGSDFSSMWAGAGRNMIEKLFKEARKKTPAIIFIDEIDSVASRRGGGGDSVARDRDATLNQLLVEMDGFAAETGIIVVGATNRIDVLDPAILRPGRFDRHVHVGLPDIKGREEILEVHTRKIKLAPEINLSAIARGTPGFSGADLANIVNESAILAARESAEYADAAHFEEARTKVIAGVQRKSMVLNEEERDLIAYHEAGHALIACLSEGTDPVHQATIIPRGQSLGFVMRLPERDHISIRKSKLLADLEVLAGGRAAEEAIFGAEAVTTGAAADIQEATSIARRMVAEWGMSPDVGMIKIDISDNGALPEKAEKAVKHLIDDAYSAASRKIRDNMDKLHAIANVLKEHETVDGDVIRDIVTAPQTTEAA